MSWKVFGIPSLLSYYYHTTAPRNLPRQCLNVHSSALLISLPVMIDLEKKNEPMQGMNLYETLGTLSTVRFSGLVINSV